MNAPVIWINGFPGTGKLTVAQKLHKLLQPSVLVDNHSLIDPVHKLLGLGARDHLLYQALRQGERTKAFMTWLWSSRFASHTIIFTDFQSTTGVGPRVASEYEISARHAGCPFIPVYSTCELHVNLERATSSERRDGGTTKLTDPILLESIISSSEIFRFNTGVEFCTTEMSAQEVAKAILAVAAEKNVECQCGGLEGREEQPADGTEDEGALENHWISNSQC